MTKLTEDMVVARTKSSDMGAIKKLNCWGSDLDDISLVRRFTNVEVLSLSLNRITSLADFQYCGNLVELYVRRNHIRDLSEICYLQELPRLKRLLLSENPCTEIGANYRATVLRCLPGLEVLDNQQVQPEEVEYAMKNGLILEHPLSRRERGGSPEPAYYSDDSPPMPNRGARRNSTHYDFEDEPSTYRNSSNSPSADYYYQNGEGRNKSPETATSTGVVQVQTNNNHSNLNTPLTRQCNNSSNSSADSHSSSAFNHSSPSVTSTTNQVEGFVQQRRISTPEYGYSRPEPEMQPIQRQMNGRRPSNDYISDGHKEQQFYEEQQQAQVRSAQVAQRQPVFVRTSSKPRTKTSNVLSAMLCLIPELDLASLEVLELTVRRRIDEFASD